ncbi:hypothetical protein, partial [uncultured Parasphingorhabdus sp.]|uniref:hypothetical protein n=1 Tax=uncultured Parasphingorhabdus sp. TaxID=2709694 RepID=UPI0030D8F475
MKLKGIATSGALVREIDSRRFVAALLTGTALTMFATPVWAQSTDAVETADSNEDVIVVSGIRGSLAKALDEKRNADSL